MSGAKSLSESSKIKTNEENIKLLHGLLICTSGFSSS